MSEYKTITEAKELKGKKVLLRLGLNVPIQDGKVIDDYRIQKSLHTIEFLKKEGAKVIILSHIGREKSATLKDVSDYLQQFVEHTFVSDIFSDEVKKNVDEMNNGDCVLFENLRQHDGEKGNTPDFVDHLASFGDVYVNEAFSNSHRDHASMTGIAKRMPHYAGIRFNEEVQKISKVFNPPQPFLLIVGGAKFETKLPLVKKFTEIANAIFLGGALSNDVYRYHGFPVDSSVTSDTPLEEIEEIIDTGKVFVPANVIVESREVKDPAKVDPNEMIMDAGPKAVEILSDLIRTAKLIVWNGPLGFYEKGFKDSTDAVIKELLKSDSEIIIGGGDTQAAISGFDTPENIFVSTAGGAMLDFLSGESLPALDALNNE